MTLDLSIRKLIKSHYDNGKSAKEIYDFLEKSVSKSTIYRWLRHFDITNSVEAIKQPGRPRSIRTKQFIKKVQKNVQLNKKKKSARLIARENNCSDFTVRKIIKEDLKLKPYRKIKVPALTERQILARKSRANWIRKNFTVAQCKKIGFSDEKIFDGDGQINAKNDIIYAKNREDANNNGGTIPKHKYPYKVMVWCLLTYQGPGEVIILPEKMKFNSDFFISNCIPVIQRDGLNKIGSDFVLQQDGASCHTSKKSIEALKNASIPIIGPNYWPPNSPDLNPLDYFFWNEVSSRLTKKKYSNRNELIQKIKETVKEIPLKMIRDTIENFHPRISFVARNHGCLLNK